MKFKTIYKKLTALFFVIVFLLLIYVLWKEIRELNKESLNETVLINELEKIKKAGFLKAAVDYNSTNYFIYKGRPIGYQYELLEALCNHLGVELEIIVNNNLEESIYGLRKGRYDLVAQNITVTGRHKELVDFTYPLEKVNQVLVQRKRKGFTDSVYVESVLDLKNKKVVVQNRSAYHERMINLSEEIGGNIEIIPDSVSEIEDLIAKVAKGQINYTVCDDNFARMNLFYYPDLDVSVKVSLEQEVAWAVRKGSMEWKHFLDNWISDFKGTRQYHFVYFKYFESPRLADRKKSEFNSISGGMISKFDPMVKQISGEFKWDWRLISAIIYNESRFNESAGSYTGAYGLMQIMPATAEAFGIEDIADPAQNVRGGILLLNSLNKQFVQSIPDSTERVKFVLAAYNIGLGHVLDAQQLAKKYGKNPLIWNENVEDFLEKKSEEKYFKDAVVKFGYCRGEEAVSFVSNVISNYRHYTNGIKL